MASTKMGSKHACPKCKAKFYDLGRSPLACPKCDTVIEAAEQGGKAKKTEVWTPPVMRNAIHTKRALTAASLMDRDDLEFVAADARSIPEVDDEAEDAEVGHLKDVEELSEQ
ncbi:MAG: TIGR02300 family protein, partial [Alphaproteobacteria bacterium]|nr:TIGR02300 family protein [Alphaproteobacteria bacterium]